MTYASETSASHRAPSLRRRAALFALAISPFLALLGLLVWSQTGPGGAGSGRLEHNATGDVPVAVRAAPEFFGTDVLTGEPVSLAALRGNVIVVDFWSSWCASCRVEAADLAAVHREYAGLPVEFVGLAIWDAPGDVARHIERYDVGYHNLIDGDGDFAVAYGVRGVPEKFFIDPEGRIVRKVNGPVDRDRLRAIIDALLPA